MNFKRFPIDGPILVEGPIFKDGRGAFSETWRAGEFGDNGIADEWAQDNMSTSVAIGTVRGLHWQIGDDAQAKLVRPVSGRIIDVAVDLRAASPTFGQAVAVELDGNANQALYVPIGFAHGFCTLEPNTIVSYKASSLYAPSAERNLFWADPELNIDWPVTVEAAILAAKDLAAPKLKELKAGDLF